MARTVIDLDDDAYRAAARELGTTSKVETVNRALAEIGRRSERLRLLDALDASDLDLSPDAMRDAWRD